MCAKWNENKPGRIFLGDVDYLCQQIDAVKTKTGGFSVTTYYRDCEAMLIASISCVDEIDFHTKDRLVSIALSKIAQRGDVISPASVMKQLALEEKKHLASQSRKYWLLTSLCLSWHPPLANTKIGGCSLFFSTSRDARYLANPEIAQKLDRLSDEKMRPVHSTHVKVTVRSRTEHEAGNKALRSLSLFLGLLNFPFNNSIIDRFIFSTPTKALNHIRSGPFYTLHDRIGESTTRAYWYEHDLHRMLGPTDLRNKWEAGHKTFTWLYQCVVKHKYRSAIEERMSPV